MDEVFKELDSSLRSDWLNGDTKESSDVRTELKELFGRHNKDKAEGRTVPRSNGSHAVTEDDRCEDSASHSFKKKSHKLPLPDDLPSVKTISDSEQHKLDQAIARAKELADQAILELDGSHENCLDSPRTPGSPTRRKFTFKFKTHSKEHRSFTDTLAKNNENVFSSILSDEAKHAYESLIDRGSVGAAPSTESDKHDSSGSLSDLVSITASTANLVTGHDEPDVSQPEVPPSQDSNPLRMLRNGVAVMPKVRGNRARFSAGPATASLARLTANASRSSLPAPPPIPRSTESIDCSEGADANPLPLPPRDRSKLVQPLKQHERKHPLLLSCEDSARSTSPSSLPTKPLMSTFKPNMPLRKSVQVGDPQLLISSNVSSSAGSSASNSSLSSPNNTIAITANTAAATGASLKSTRQLM
jgi:hypothetical protein